jgi:sodium/potassium/calcium exchanger 6
MADDTEVFLIPYDYLHEHIFKGIKPLFYIVIFLWIVALFYSMYVIADRHFTWALEHLANFLRLSPDMAGLTLLAFGNGAPDFFTAVFGASKEPEMILGSSVGSGLFIVTVIFGLVILVAKRPGKGRILVSENGQVTSEEDHPESMTKFISCTEIKHQIEPVPFLRNTIMYLLCVGFLATFAVLKKIPFWLPLILLGIYFIYLGAAIAVHFGTRRSRNSLKPQRASLAASLILGDEHVIVQEREKAMAKFWAQSLAFKVYFLFRTTCWQDEWSASWSSAIWRLCTVIVKAPINFAFNCTILPIEVPEDSLSVDNFVALKILHRIRCAMNPILSSALYIMLLVPEPDQLPWYIWCVYGIGSVLICISLWITTSWTSPPKFFALHVLYSFCTCILWIYASSSELVSCLSSTGATMGVPPTVTGILVLAWGNSFGDLVADVAIAKNGALETAIAAIFSGPVQNVLLTIGAGFLIAALQNPKHEVLVSSLRFDMYLALALLAVVVLACLIIVPFWFDFKIPRNFGFVLFTVYMLYLPCALVLGLDIVKIPHSS